MNIRIAAAAAAVPALAAAAGAQQIRVQPFLQDAEPTSIWVAWETDADVPGEVLFGTSAASLDRTAASDRIPSFGSSVIHHARLEGLEPDTKYFYRVVAGQAATATRRFRTPPLHEAEKPFRFVALSDMQGGPIPDMHTRVINDGVIGFVEDNFGAALEDELAFAIIPGDLVSTGSDYSQWKTQFFDESSNLYQYIPVYPVAGNHEQDSHWYFDYFRLPTNGTPGLEEHWYYKDYGNVRIIGMDTNTGYRTQTQLAWLDDVLAETAPLTHIDFVFAQMHHPHLSEAWTPGNTDYTGEIVRRLEAFSDATGKPTVHFFGHTHAYSRGQSRDHNHLWVNVAAGEGGIDYWGAFPNEDYPEFQRTFVTWGFVVLEVQAGEDPRFRLRRVDLGNEVAPTQNQILDDITIRRNNQPPATPAGVLPADGAIGIDPFAAHLAGSDFLDPDGDFHAEAHYELVPQGGGDTLDHWIRFENWYRPEDAAGRETGYYSVNTVEDPDVSRTTVTGLIPGETYTWRVRYRDSALAWSGWSAPRTFSTATVPVGACCFADGRCDETFEASCGESGGEWLGDGSLCDACPEIITVFEESFDGVVLGPSVDENPAGAAVWTKLPPEGWNIDDTGVPAGGVTEWRGWSFADPAWWSLVAEDQGRAGFDLATGPVAVADPDEWDDAPRQPGTFNTKLVTPTIPLGEIRNATAAVAFDSSWVPEGAQRAEVTASFDGAPPVTILDWRSEAGPAFKASAQSERVIIPLHAPADATSVVLAFALLDAGNNWWWAIDDVAVVGEAARASTTLLFEDFEALPLGPSVDEPPAAGVWTDTPPSGWTIDDAGVPSIGNPTQGVTEWEGWAFTDKAWWTEVAGDQLRSQFTLASGTVAVADPDEWDDKGNPEALGLYATTLRSPPIDLRGVRPGSVTITFLSSWRPEDNQTARLNALHGSGDALTLLEWRSTAGPFFKPDATNEPISLQAPLPASTETVVFAWELSQAANDWWWAIDDVRVRGVCLADIDADGEIGFGDVVNFVQAFNAGQATADADADGSLTFADVARFITAFGAGCQAS